MKKNITKLFITITLVIVAFTSLILFTACKNNEEKPLEIIVAAPDGAPSLALAKLMKDVHKIDNVSISYQIKDGTGIVSAVVSKEADIALMPMNLAAKLYNEGTEIKLVSTNIHGLLYLVGPDNDYVDLSSLVGKVVYNVGQGGTPDFTFKQILTKKNIAWEESNEPISGKIALAYETPLTLVPKFKQGTIDYAVLGEPQATVAITNTDKKKIGDLQKLWKEINNFEEEGFPQVGLVIKSSLLESHPEFVKKFIVEVEANIAWLKENPAEAKAVIEDNNGQMPLLNKSIVESCNFKVVSASDSKNAVETYLLALPGPAYGNKLPDNDFYATIK